MKAKSEAEQLIADARSRADANYKSELDKARKAAEAKISAAEQAAAEVVRQSESKAKEEQEALREAAGAKRQAAVKAVIDSLVS